MISLIVCSANSSMLEEFKDNVRLTIGVEYELIIFDNRIKRYGLCRVYNECAEKAKYDFLLFVHEDMYFFTKGWGKILVDFYQSQSNCGVIGLAGSKYVDEYFVEWRIDRHVSYSHIFVSSKKELPIERINLRSYHNGKNSFEQVIVIDGMFMFTSKEVFMSFRFDENNYDDFHIYDTDFSFSVSTKYDNYVCTLIDSFHRSQSSFSKNYVEGLLSFLEKRREMLPKSCKYILPFHKRLIKIHEEILFLNTLKDNCFTTDESKDLINRYRLDHKGISTIDRFVDFFYGKLMSIKSRKIYCSAN